MPDAGERLLQNESQWFLVVVFYSRQLSEGKLPPPPGLLVLTHGC